MSTYFLTIAEIAVGSFYTIHSFVTEQRDKEMPKSVPPTGWTQGYHLQSNPTLYFVGEQNKNIWMLMAR